MLLSEEVTKFYGERKLSLKVDVQWGFMSFA